jgi:hypothetical protein
MDSPGPRAALNSIHKQDNLCFFKGIQQSEGPTRQFQKVAATITASLEAVDDF